MPGRNAGGVSFDASFDVLRAFAALAVGCCLLLGASCFAQPSPTEIRDQRLKAFLQHALRGEKDTRYVAAFFDLNDDERQEAIVYFMGPMYCGTGGCETWVLAPKGTSYRIVSKISVVQLPIRALATKSHGWHELGVAVRGGGIHRAYEARLPFNGRRYPHNPTVAPARRITGAVAIKTLIPELAQARPLFP
jgi:hypothetical protein